MFDSGSEYAKQWQAVEFKESREAIQTIAGSPLERCGRLFCLRGGAVPGGPGMRGLSSGFSVPQLSATSAPDPAR